MKNIIITLIAIVILSGCNSSLSKENTDVASVALQNNDWETYLDFMISDSLPEAMEQAKCMAEITFAAAAGKRGKEFDAYVESEEWEAVLLSTLGCMEHFNFDLAAERIFGKSESEEVIIDPIKEAEEAAAEQARIEAEEAAHQKRLAQDELDRIKDQVRHQRLMDLNSRLDAIDSY